MAPMMKVGMKESQSLVADIVAKHSWEWLLLEASEAQAVRLLAAATSSAAVALYLSRSVRYTLAYHSRVGQTGCPSGCSGQIYRVCFEI